MGEYIFRNNKIYKYNDKKCETQFNDYVNALNDFKNSIIQFCELYVNFNDKLVDFNECLNDNGTVKFTPSITINKEITSDQITSIQVELNTFFNDLNNDIKEDCKSTKEELDSVLESLFNEKTKLSTQLAAVAAYLDDFNNCLSSNSFPEFQQKDLNINSTIECVDNVLNDLNEFYLDFYILIENPEELFFINHDEINMENEYTNIIYFESNMGDTFLLKNLDGKCNMYFECSTGNIYIFNENNNKWNITCNISNNTVE